MGPHYVIVNIKYPDEKSEINFVYVGGNNMGEAAPYYFTNDSMSIPFNEFYGRLKLKND